MQMGIRIAIVVFLAVLAYGLFLVLTQRTISREDAHRLVEQEGAALVDVRTPREFAAGHLPGAVNLPLGQIADRASELGGPDRPLVLYCQSGARSAAAVRALKKAGFRQVYNLGSIHNW